MGFGYISTVVIFAVLVAVMKLDVDKAYQIVQGPLMTLIGGSLAIAKDLLQLDSREDMKSGNGGERTAEGREEQ